MWAQEQGGTAQSYLLATPQNYSERNQQLPFEHEACVSADQVRRLQTIPGIKGLTMTGKYPIAEVAYDVPGLPVELSLEAMTPLIPDDPKASGLPAAVFTFTAKNPGSKPVDVRLLEAQQNFLGWDGLKDATAAATPFYGTNVNAPFASGAGGLSGLAMSASGVEPGTNLDGTLCVAAVPGAGLKPGVIAGAADEQALWAAFTGGHIAAPGAAQPTPESAAGKSWSGGVVQSFTVPAGGTVTVQFILAWSFPHRSAKVSASQGHPGIANKLSPTAAPPLPTILGNMYGNWFKNATDAAQYLHSNSADLLATTRLYVDTLFGSTMPPCLLDSAAGRVAVARSPTMWVCKDGTVMGCEGNRCCPLNCSHVYGYTMLVERLFPSLARSMVHSNFVRNFDPVKGVSMRFGIGGFALDGALASVLKCYITVRQSDPQGEWLKTVWPNVRAQMELVINGFDVQHDGVIRGPQQNTYDSTMVGANTFHGSYYVAALKASAAMSALVEKDPDFVNLCTTRAALSSANYEKICWKEEFGYYIADVNASNCANSYGPGCFVDQLCAIGLASAAGFGYNFAPAHEASARKAILKYNKQHKPPFQDQQKHFFDGDEGITVCRYPNGKLKGGMKYESLVSAGFTSPVIAGMLLDRNLPDAEQTASMIRRRQDGRNRSPWNEPECQILYSRSMAHWNIFDQACGHAYDSTTASLAYDPRYFAADGSFQCFFHMDGGWGQFKQKGPSGLPSGVASLTVLRGAVTLAQLKLASTATRATAAVAGKQVPVHLTKVDARTIALTFSPELKLPSGAALAVTLAAGDATLELPTAQPELRFRGSREPCCPAGSCCPAPDTSKPTASAITPQTQTSAGFRATFLAICAILLFLGGMLLGSRVPVSL